MKTTKRGKLLMLASAALVAVLACMNPAKSAGMIFIYYSRSKTAPR